MEERWSAVRYNPRAVMRALGRDRPQHPAMTADPIAGGDSVRYPSSVSSYSSRSFEAEPEEPPERRQHAASIAQVNAAREQALRSHVNRVGRRLHRLSGGQRPGCHQGKPRAVRDLDDVDPVTREPRFYRTASAAAVALGVGRAHHVLRAIGRNGRAGGHRLMTDAQYRAEPGSAQQKARENFPGLLCG